MVVAMAVEEARGAVRPPGNSVCERVLACTCKRARADERKG